MASTHCPSPLPPLLGRTACHICQANGLQSVWCWCVIPPHFSYFPTLTFFSHSPMYHPCPHSLAEAMQQCEYFSSNSVRSCFPTSDTSVPQHDWATFVCTYPPTRSRLETYLLISSIKGIAGFLISPRPTSSTFTFSTQIQAMRF